MAGCKISRPFIAGTQTQPTLAKTLAARLIAFSKRETTFSGLQSSDGVRVVCVSDTHNSQPTLPDGHLLIHAGDLSQYGTFNEVQSQLDWLNAQPHEHKIVIAGNHDLILDEEFVKAHPDRELDKPSKTREDLDWGSIHYLQDSLCTMVVGERKFTVYGGPWTPRCGNFAFQYDPQDGEKIWSHKLPRRLDILVTHGPPFAHLDQGKGCLSLLEVLWRVQPSLIVCGHIHSAHGEELLWFDDVQECYENTARGLWAWWNLLKLLIYAMLGMLRGQRQIGRPTRLVNVAVAGREEKNVVTIVHL
jgi:hypothetical protein